MWFRPVSLSGRYDSDCCSTGFFNSKMTSNHRLAKYWLWIVSSAFLLLAAQAMPSAAPTGTSSCGLGLAPDASGFAQQEARREAEVSKNGFLRVCEANLERYSITFMPMASVTTGVNFKPTDLSNTPFAQLKSLGGRSETVLDTKSRLYRGFRTPEGHTLTLFENDMSADGTSMWRDPKDEPERVNSLPARLVVLETNSGRAVSVLSWVQGRRYYEIWLNANAARNPLRAHLFSLANSLPLSIPACPKEPVPKQVPSGPNGFPVHEPMPLTLTIEQMEAFGKKRTCR